MPVLIIWGREDEVVPLTVGKNFKRDIPDSELVILPHCGHMPPEEEPLATSQADHGFLKKVYFKEIVTNYATLLG